MVRPKSSMPPVVPIRTARQRVIAISGGKGGVGKSTLSVNLACTFASMGSRTLVFDGDLGMADLNLLFGVAPELTLLDLLTGGDPDEILIETHGIHLLPALNGSYALANLEEGVRNKLIRAVAQLAMNFETLVVDTAAGIHQNNMALTAMASEVLVVATPEPLSLADAYACLKVLAKDLGKDRIFLVPNNVRSQDEARAVVAQLDKLARRFLGVELIPLPHIPHDPMVPVAAAEGVPLAISRPDSPACRAVKRVARELDAIALREAPGPTARDRLQALAAGAELV
ncbi:MAG: P-loop NTPase [Myxococcota bacterium]